LKHVLIAHQSAIPHYRVPFYEAVEKLRPSWWDFSVVFDPRPDRRSTMYIEPSDIGQFGFNVHHTRTFIAGLSGSTQLLFQTFPFSCGGYDLLVMEDSLHNLAYPLSRIWGALGKSVVYWGHGRDTSVGSRKGWKALAERVKLRLVRSSSGFFAYTSGVRDYLMIRGMAQDRIFVLNNTIDINAERAAYLDVVDRRDQVRSDLGVGSKRVLLFVGRLNERKHLDFLGEVVAVLRGRDPRYHLMVIGGGDRGLLEAVRDRVGQDGLTYGGVVVERKALAERFVAGDLFVFPGDVGLGVIHALCYDLRPLVIERSTHNPEFEYLNETNATVLAAGTTPSQYADAIEDLFSVDGDTRIGGANGWESIRHLTIDRMARNFIEGINYLLPEG
jgi:glycosyltransferase involved in cell wall biosynthesis